MKTITQLHKFIHKIEDGDIQRIEFQEKDGKHIFATSSRETIIVLTKRIIEFYRNAILYAENDTGDDFYGNNIEIEDNSIDNGRKEKEDFYGQRTTEAQNINGSEKKKSRT